jgi:DNA replication protein DnaC
MSNEWHSAVWWRNRSAEERVGNLHIPRRLLRAIDADARTKNVHEWEPGQNLLIVGPRQIGKSTNAARILHSTVASDKVSGRWVDADEYVEMLKDSFSNDGLLPEMYSSPHLIKYIKGVFDIVVIDGLGDERQTDFAVHELGTLIRQRHDRDLSTIITSSLSPKNIASKYGNRVSAALEDYEVISNGR